MLLLMFYSLAVQLLQFLLVAVIPASSQTDLKLKALHFVYLQVSPSEASGEVWESEAV